MSSAHSEPTNNQNQEQRRRRMRRAQQGIAIFVLCNAVIAFASVAGNARFENYHSLDVIRLVAAGAGFGVALVLLIQFFCLPEFRSEPKKE